MNDLGRFTIDVQVQDNGKLDIWVAHEGNSGTHYTDVDADLAGQHIADLIDCVAEENAAEYANKRTSKMLPTEDIGEWVCTDSDCMQYGRQLSEMMFEYIECREFLNGHFYVCAKTIDLTTYTLEEVNQYITGYYGNLDTLAEYYGPKDRRRICAECIFEQQSLFEMSFVEICESLAEAEQIITAYINTKGAQAV